MSKTFNVDDVGPPDGDIDLDELDLEPDLDDSMEPTTNGRFNRPQSASKKKVWRSFHWEKGIEIEHSLNRYIPWESASIHASAENCESLYIATVLIMRHLL